MQNKGAIKIFALLLALCCIFYLSFTYVVRSAEKELDDKAEGRIQLKYYQDRIKNLAGNNEVDQSTFRQVFKDSILNHYLDSLNPIKIYSLGIVDYTYEDCKKREINLGLDLRGGINVILEVSVGDIIKGLSGNNKDPQFNQALQTAKEKLGGQNSDFVELFEREYTALVPNGKLAPFFQTTEIRSKIDYNAPNEKVVGVIREVVNDNLKNVENTLRSRIQNIGVSQPNIRSVGSASSGRVLVELPGAKNIEKVKTLLERTANLEFWEMYENFDMNQYWDAANKKVRQYIIRDTLVSVDTTKAIDSTKTAKVNPADTAKVKNTLDSVKKDTGLTGLNKTKTTKGPSAEQERKRDSILKIYPISRYLIPNTDQKGYLVDAPSCGFVAKGDTAKLMSWLNNPDVKKAFPTNLKFALDAYPSKFFTGYYELYALKSSEFRVMRPALSGDVIEDARQGFDNFGKPNIDMVMKGEAANKWRAITERCVAESNKQKPKDGKARGKAIAIVMDNMVFSAPTVNNVIPNGRSEISGSFDIKEAQSLASVLKAGKLPAPARIVASSEVGPTLGEEAINSGILSFVGSIVLILLFMVLYYNRAGTIADLALFINIFFIMGVLASWGEVLTFPGIAGIILTIGLSVDANILIFERVREELALGKSNALAIREGFKHAMSSIIDSNVTLLILGIILFAFGSGPIQGFASTLIVGILSSLFAAVLLSRVVFEWFIGRKKDVSFDNKLTRNAFKNVSFDFVKRRKVYYALSSLIIITGFIFYFKNNGFHLGIDFQGGRTYQIQFEKAMNVEDMKSTLKPVFGNEKPEITSVGSDKQLKITTAYKVNVAGADTDKQIREAIGQKLTESGAKFKIVAEQKVGPAIASDILYKAYMAVLFSCFMMFIYILVRFKKWQYGLGAVIALLHDVLVVLSCYTILDGVLPFSLEIGQDFIAAILTVMGYTMTETVVVFDRIRERLAESGKEDVYGEERNKLINFALNSTLSRTILTSLTVFFVLLVIFIFGGDSIRGFIFALLVGRVIGTYSSLCISTPIVVDFERKKKV